MWLDAKEKVKMSFIIILLIQLVCFYIIFTKKPPSMKTFASVILVCCSVVVYLNTTGYVRIINLVAAILWGVNIGMYLATWIREKKTETR